MARMEKEKGNSDIQTQAVPWWTSCRFTLCMLSFFGSIFMYMMRANMSVAIVCMTSQPRIDNNHTVHNNSNISFGSIYADGNKRNGEFTWSRELRGFVLSSYYIGYILTQFPGGWLSNRIGAKRILGVGMSMMTVLTLLTPVAARASVYLLMVVQALKGFSSGVFFPGFYQLYGRWAPPHERSVLLAVFSAGTPVGSVLSSILSGILCQHGFDGGWPSIFYLFGSASAIWCIVWFVLAYSSPQEHPRISKAELDYIQASLPSVSQNTSLHIPWKDLLRSIPVYALFFVDLCYIWCWYVALSTLPQYMKDVLKFDIKSNGLFNSLPYIANFVISILASVIADSIISRKLLPTTWTRKLFTTLAMVPSAALSLGVAALNSDQRTVAVILLTLWVGLMGFARSGTYVNIVDLAPRYSGILMGIDNTIKTIPGIIAPPIVSAMTPNGAIEEWRRVYILGTCITLVGWIVYIIFGSAEEQPWSRVGSDTGVDKEQNPTGSDNHGFAVTPKEDDHKQNGTKF